VGEIAHGRELIHVHIRCSDISLAIHQRYSGPYKQLDSIAPVYPDEPGLFDDPKDWGTPKTV
jgi:hypothetical protein